MSKKEIIKAIADKRDSTQQDAKKMIEDTLAAIVESLISDRRVELRNFGVFEVKQRKARIARNPHTNEQFPVEAKQVITFKPGKQMLERVRARIEESEAVATG